MIGSRLDGMGLWRGALAGLIVALGAGAAVDAGEPTFVELARRADALPTGSRLDAPDETLLAYRISPEAIAARKKEVVDVAAQADPGEKENGKQSLRVALARLARDPSDKAALQCIQRVAPFEAKDDHFTKIGLAQVYGRFGASFPASVQAAVRAQAETYTKWRSAHGTENHLGMRRVAGLVFGEAFPEMKTAEGLSGRELADQDIEWVRRYVKAVFRWGMAEYLSTIYLGVHNEIWLTGREFARGDAGRLMSRAMLDWMWTDLAVNAHLGQVLPPLPRDKIMIDRGTQMAYPTTHVQWLAWLYWGDERSRPGKEDLPPYVAGVKPGTTIKELFSHDEASGFQTAILPSVSEEIPNEIIRNIGVKKVATPYRLLQSRPNLATLTAASEDAKEKTSANDSMARYNLRSVYVARDYAIGAGYFRFAREVGEPDNLKHLTPSGIVYKSDDTLNRIQVSHPYWYTARVDEQTERPLGLDNWSGKSPFEQSVHWDNTLLYVFDIPETDPYTEAAPSAAKEKWVSERTPKCIRTVCVYVPASIDEKRETPWGWLLREGDVYIAVRPFGVERTEWQKCDHPVLAGHDRLVLHGSRMGVVLEAGDRAEWGSAEAFADKVGKAALGLSKLQTEKEAQYVSTRGAALRLRFVPGGGFPRAWVDGAALDFENWPICESPYVTCRDGILDVNDGSKGFTIDWNGDWPAYAYYDLADGKRTVTRREWLDHGQLKAE